MPQFFEIRGGRTISGRVDVGGSKNASFPILAATVLLNRKILIRNLPQIEDIKCFLEILRSLGAKIRQIKKNEFLLDPTTIKTTSVPFSLGSKIRGSYYLLGALIGKFGRAKIPPPGGCNIGTRPMDLHFKALAKIGVDFRQNNKSISGRLKKVKQNHIIIRLPFPSRGATINTLLASVLYKGKQIKIINYNKSPETESLINFLRQAGAKIKKSREALTVWGQPSLAVDSFSVMPDKIEAATLLLAGVITRGKVSVCKVQINHLRHFLKKLKQLGVRYKVGKSSVTVYPAGKFKAARIIAGLKENSLDADFEPMLVPILCLAEGKSFIQDNINPRRHSRFLPQLSAMGGKIFMVTETEAVIFGPMNFAGKKDLIASDIRGGAALILASLAAKGTSRIGNIYQIDRGYENLEKKLRILSAKIKRRT